MQIGDKLWCHDYRNHGKPWFEETISGETRASWLLGSAKAYKVNKKTLLENQGQWGNVQWHTEQSMQDYCWMSKHRYAIAGRVGKCGDLATLRQVANLIGYEADDGTTLTNGIGND